MFETFIWSVCLCKQLILLWPPHRFSEIQIKGRNICCTSRKAVKLLCGRNVIHATMASITSSWFQPSLLKWKKKKSNVSGVHWLILIIRLVTQRFPHKLLDRPVAFICIFCPCGSLIFSVGKQCAMIMFIIIGRKTLQK